MFVSIVRVISIHVQFIYLLLQGIKTLHITVVYHSLNMRHSQSGDQVPVSMGKIKYIYICIMFS